MNEIVAKLISAPSGALERGKAGIREVGSMGGLAGKYEVASRVMAREMCTEDAVEGTRAMLQKRDARFY